MSQISELRDASVKRGNELLREHELLIRKAKEIEDEVKAINGEIRGYNKIEPPTEDAPSPNPEEPVT